MGEPNIDPMFILPPEILTMVSWRILPGWPSKYPDGDRCFVEEYDVWLALADYEVEKIRRFGDGKPIWGVPKFLSEVEKRGIG